MNTTLPSLEILDTLTAPDRERGVPLHVQVRQAIRHVIDEHFEDGQQFWTEQALMDRLCVSQITVRRALNDLAKDGFLMRRAAKGTFVRKPTITQTADFRVGLFVPKYNSDILNNDIEHFVNECHERGQRIHVHYTQKGEKTREVFSAIEHSPEQERIVLLALPRQLMLDTLETLAQHGYRAIAVDTTIPHDQTDYVGYDDDLGIRLALDHLTGLGHKRITLIVNEPETADSVLVRRKAFERICAQEGIDGSIVSCGVTFWESAYDAAYAAMDRVWTPEAKPTAILTVSDAGAWAVMRWCAEHSVRVPEEVSVMGFDDDRLSRYTHPSLTTLGRDRKELARQSLNLLSLPAAQRSKNLIPPYVVRRESTGPVPE